MTFVSLLDSRLGNLVDHNDEADALMAAADVANAVTLPLDNGIQLWRYMDTPKYRKMVKAQDTMYR